MAAKPKGISEEVLLKQLEIANERSRWYTAQILAVPGSFAVGVPKLIELLGKPFVGGCCIVLAAFLLYMRKSLRNRVDQIEAVELALGFPKKSVEFRNDFWSSVTGMVFAAGVALLLLS